MTHAIFVSAPARLHFGLLSFGHGESADSQLRQFGGVGVMLADPRVELQIRPADAFHVSGCELERVGQIAEAWMKATSQRPNCTVHVRSVIPAHVGLGSGTQLSHAVAAGLSRFCDPNFELDPYELAKLDGRGRRSAVGTYGFCAGGCIADDGKLPNEPLGRLRCRTDVPENWRFVLIRPAEEKGLCGAEETRAFGGLPSVAPEVSERLLELMTDRIIPACESEDFEGFCSAVYEYGLEAGNCFVKCQGGPFASPRLEKLVNSIRRLGYSGVGQSSWGPTLFVVTEHQEAAEQLVLALNQWDDDGVRDWEIGITRPDNQGARIHRCDESTNLAGRGGKS